MHNIPFKIRKAVYERDSIDDMPCCVYCGQPGSVDGLHLHHYIRRSKGGKDEVKNLVSLDFKCHRALHDGNKEIEQAIRDYLRSFYGDEIT